MEERATYGRCSLSVSGGTLGTMQTLKVSIPGSNYTYSITYTCGSEGGSICSNSSSTNVNWVPPMSLAKQNTTGRYVEVSFKVYTLYNGSLVGEMLYTAGYMIPEMIKPSVNDGWVTVVPNNTGTAAGGLNAFVQNYSRAQFTFDTSKIGTPYGASIAGFRVVVNNHTLTSSPYLSPVITTAGVLNAICEVYDTRGRYARQTLQIVVSQYSPPTIYSVSLHRCSATGEKSESGSYILVQATARVSDVSGLNRVTMRARIKPTGGEYGAYITLAEESGSVVVYKVIGDGTLSEDSSCEVEISVVDTMGGSAVYVDYVAGGATFFMGKEGGTGAAFGKTAEMDNTLDVGWDLVVRRDLYLGSQGNKVEDFVCEQGASGAWQYRKWNSGRVELWSRQTINSGTFSGDVVYQSQLSISLPYQMWTDKAVAAVSLYGSGVVWAASTVVLADAVQFTACRIGGTGALDLTAQIYVSGYTA